MLANFAAGIFLVILQPFKVGDVVVAGGVTGTVEEVGLFVTSINTLETSATSWVNGKIFGDIIQNFSSMLTLSSPLSKPTWPRSRMC